MSDTSRSSSHRASRSFAHLLRLRGPLALAGGLSLAAAPVATLVHTSPAAAHGHACSELPNHASLRAALKAVVSGGGNGGFALNMWATVVNRDGEVCAVAFTGNDRGAQWPGSRVISAQKANTANAFSLPGFALATANLFSAVQPGGSLFGLQHSNPVSTQVAYQGPAGNFGQPNDPMVGQRIGGVNVFGGGLALYNAAGKLVGGIGVSGDTSCTDHIVAWKTRDKLLLDRVPAGPVGGTDNTTHDIAGGVSASGWGHPTCDAAATGIAATLPAAFPYGP
jgi:uncharacterized protein GlcG (DUF336 family)